jgi:hypothetical protein
MAYVGYTEICKVGSIIGIVASQSYGTQMCEQPSI